MTRFIYILIALIFLSSCATSQGYDYAAHKKRSQKAADYYRKGGGCKRKHWLHRVMVLQYPRLWVYTPRYKL